MQEDRTVKIIVFMTVVGFFAIAVFIYFWAQQPTIKITPLQVIPIENVLANNRVYQIVPEESEARFELNELLRGVETAVIGSTNQIAGQVAFNLNELDAIQMGTITINARALSTDSNLRNTALRNDILFAHLYEFITFEPTGMTQITRPVEMGDPVSFTVSGELTVRDISNSETFSVVAQQVTPTRITGYATTTISRGAYQLNIPTVPNVADVDDLVILEIDFVAEWVE